MVRTALMGCGRIGRMHADNLAAHPGTSLAGVFDVHRPSAEAVAARHGVPVYPDADAVFAAAEVDAILIASVTETHADYLEKAVLAGKPVFCEKPIDLSLSRVDRCAQAIAGRPAVIQLGFNRRFDPGHRAAWKAVREGEIGDLHQVLITSRDPAMPPRSYYESAGGMLRDMTIHDFDLARYFLGEEPVEVFAIAGRRIDPPMMDEIDDHDTAMIVLRTASGRQCHINNIRQSRYGYDQRVECVGAEGMLVSENRRPHELRRFGGRATEAGQPYLDFFIERYAEAFMAELTEFASAVGESRQPEVGFEDGRRALVLAEAAYRSIAEGRMVRVDEIG
jgi:myo-inositol 2-dehydrogenase / D-chiro-inositol 1-dehydrogenase